MPSALTDGVKELCDIDNDIQSLIAPRYDEIICLLNRYVDEIELFNGSYGLVSVAGTEELIIKHILDSLAPLGIIWRILNELHITDTAWVADIGSGAGLPGIVLAITLPQCRFTLIERMKRRAGFLLNTTAALGLSNTAVEEGELEKAAANRFNLVTFRAFKPLERKLLASLFNTCTGNGVIAAYKGKREKIDQEMSPLEKYCGSWEAIPCTVPFLNEERHLLVINN